MASDPRSGEERRARLKEAYKRDLRARKVFAEELSRKRHLANIDRSLAEMERMAQDIGVSLEEAEPSAPPATGTEQAPGSPPLPSTKAPDEHDEPPPTALAHLRARLPKQGPLPAEPSGQGESPRPKSLHPALGEEDPAQQEASDQKAEPDSPAEPEAPSSSAEKAPPKSGGKTLGW